MLRVRKTSRTSPEPLCIEKFLPSPVAMPAASWPRCWSSSSESYSNWLTGPFETTPTIPHMFESSTGYDERLKHDPSRVMRTILEVHATRPLVGQPRLDGAHRALRDTRQHRVAPHRLPRQVGQAGEDHERQHDQHAARQSEHAAEAAVDDASVPTHE